MKHSNWIKFPNTGCSAHSILILFFFRVFVRIYLIEKAVYETAFIENLKVFHLLTYANILYGNIKLIGNTYYHPTFGGTI